MIPDKVFGEIKPPATNPIPLVKSRGSALEIPPFYSFLLVYPPFESPTKANHLIYSFFAKSLDHLFFFFFIPRRFSSSQRTAHLSHGRKTNRLVNPTASTKLISLLFSAPPSLEPSNKRSSQLFVAERRERRSETKGKERLDNHVGATKVFRSSSNSYL